jgi:hypothetical protein
VTGQHAVVFLAADRLSDRPETGFRGDLELPFQGRRMWICGFHHGGVSLPALGALGSGPGM